MQNLKRSVGALLALLTVASTAVQALQTVDPFSAPTGGSNLHNTMLQRNVGQPVVFYGIYSDNTAGPESGLGLKVLYDGLKLTNVSVTEEYTKCRIAQAQYPASNVPPTTPTASDQVVMGWIDTAMRQTGVAATADGSVGWPDLADLASGGCLNPGTPPINTDTLAASSTALKLFKFSATTAANFSGSTTVTLDAGQNFSYASGAATSGFTPKQFFVQFSNTAVSLVSVASRKTHAFGDGDVNVTSIGAASVAAAAAGGAITVESRLAVAGVHAIRMQFDGNVNSVGAITASALTASGTTVLPAPTLAAGSLGTTVLTVNLTGVPDASRVLITVNDVNTVGSLPVTAAVGFLLGDVNNVNGVGPTDVAIVKAQSGSAVSAANFRSDVNVSGGNLGPTDIAIVKAQSGKALP